MDEKKKLSNRNEKEQIFFQLSLIIYFYENSRCAFSSYFLKKKISKNIKFFFYKVLKETITNNKLRLRSFSFIVRFAFSEIYLYI